VEGMQTMRIDFLPARRTHASAGVFVFSIFLLSPYAAPAQPAGINWQLTWSDEFDGTGAPDPTKWDMPEYNRRQNDNGPDGWWLKEDSYLDGQGHLIQRVKQIPNRNADSDPFDYSCGAIRSKGLFEQCYGRFEIRCKLQTQQGWWSAFWLFAESVFTVDGSGEDGTEIDIFEALGWTDQIGHALHWDGYGEDQGTAGMRPTIAGIHEGFHVFALEWDENEYRFYVDGEETWRTDTGGVSKVASYVKVTTEISTESWATSEYWAQDPSEAVYPDSFVVDYVRVYQDSDSSGARGHSERPPRGPSPDPLSVAASSGIAILRFTMSENADVYLGVYDSGGRLLRILINERLGVGAHRIVWNRGEDLDTPTSSSVYLLKGRLGRHPVSGRFVIAK